RIRIEALEGGPLGAAVSRFVESLPRRACALVIGAGDVEHARDELLQQLALRSPAAGRARA
ncbi:MAG: hypothetical protein O7B99_00570, partial [Planctomycetota bacterium]|nr:hypothetical protein [Planctomycetota bacterium]